MHHDRQHLQLDDLVAATRATLARIASDFSPAALASSLAAEDMVLTDLILRDGLPIGIFTLDTGRLQPGNPGHAGRASRTSTVIRSPPGNRTAAAVRDYVTRHGENAFYDSVELRHECCRIRKVEPLQRALAGRRAWLTGQRRSQAVTRGALAIEEHDAAHGMAKFNPLADWSEQDVWDYIHAHHVPYNPLHDQGYRSIGCAPCTRPVGPGEDLRAGRWWWETPESKECGLHVVDGKLVRIKQAAEPDPAAHHPKPRTA